MIADAMLYRGPHGGRPVSTLQVSKLESLILDKICRLDYVTMAGYSDDGREVTILVIHDDDDDRFGEIIRGICSGGTSIEHEMPDRTVITVPIHDGPDLPDDVLAGRKAIYTREACP